MGIIHSYLPVVAAAGGQVHDALPQGDCGGAPGGFSAVIGHVVVGQMALRRQAHHPGGRGKDAVFEQGVPDLQRLKKMRIKQFHFKPPSRFNSMV